MAGISQIGEVSTPINQIQFETQYQAQVHARQQQVVRDVGTAALNLIQSLVYFDPYVGQNLDVLA
jgi:hypothetical protein